MTPARNFYDSPSQIEITVVTIPLAMLMKEYCVSREPVNHSPPAAASWATLTGASPQFLDTSDETRDFDVVRSGDLGLARPGSFKSHLYRTRARSFMASVFGRERHGQRRNRSPATDRAVSGFLYRAGLAYAAAVFVSGYGESVPAS